MGGREVTREMKEEQTYLRLYVNRTVLSDEIAFAFRLPWKIHGSRSCDLRKMNQLGEIKRR